MACSGRLNSATLDIAADAHGVIQIFNVAAERMWCYSAAEVTNTITPAERPSPGLSARHNLDLEFDSDRAGVRSAGFSPRGDEDIYELTKVRRTSRFPAVVSVTALRDAHDTIIGYLLIGTDNTARQEVEEERKKLDQRLRDQQFYTRSLIESNIDALMTCDPRGIITDVNKQTEALTGCTRDELIGAPFKDYFTDAGRAEAGIKSVWPKAESELRATARATTEGKRGVVQATPSPTVPTLQACSRGAGQTELKRSRPGAAERDQVSATPRTAAELAVVNQELEASYIPCPDCARAADSPGTSRCCRGQPGAVVRKGDAIPENITRGEEMGQLMTPAGVLEWAGPRPRTSVGWAKWFRVIRSWKWRQGTAHLWT